MYVWTGSVVKTFPCVTEHEGLVPVYSTSIPAPILKQTKAEFNSTPICSRSAGGLFPLVVSAEIVFAFLNSMRATYLSHLILPYLVIAVFAESMPTNYGVH